jgi:hypothetical protein
MCSGLAQQLLERRIMPASSIFLNSSFALASLAGSLLFRPPRSQDLMLDAVFR